MWQGSFGRVYLGKWRETTVAIKLLSQPLMPGQHGIGEYAAIGANLQRAKCVHDWVSYAAPSLTASRLCYEACLLHSRDAH